MINLGEHDRIVTAWCERHSGPGWGNSPVHVIIRDGNQKLREEYLQPGEQPPGLAAIYDAAEALNIAVFNMIVRHIKNNQTSARKT